MPPTVRVVLTLTTALFGTSLSAAPSAESSTRAALEAVHKLAETSAPAAVRRLEALQATLGDAAPYELRRELLRTEVWLRQDAGQVEQAYAAGQTALALALANEDAAGAAMARLGRVQRLVDEGQPDKAQEELGRIVKDAPGSPPDDLQVALAIAQGDVHNARAQFDKALASYLEGLKLLQDKANGSETRGQLYSYIARVYMNSDNAPKALETTVRGLAERGLPVRTAGTLQFTQGLAFMRLDRPHDAIQAFRRALGMAVRGGLRGLEASVRGNIADYHLRRRDYRSAEHEARQALQASERVAYQQLIIMARANLGFALLGQGRRAEGLPLVDGVIADLRRARSWTDLEAMLDEKSRMEEMAGQHQQALHALREQQQLRQTASRLARDRAIALLQEEFEAKQRTRQIAFLHRENAIKEAELSHRRTAQRAATFAAVLTVLAGMVVFVLYRRARLAAAHLRQLNVQLEFHSMRDALTGLHNRRFFLEQMNAAVAASGERRHPEPDEADCYVLMDIDHFKQINDRWGHDMGDAVLVEVARRLSLAVRESDMLLRWGGEEFLIYAPGTNPACIAELASRVLLGIGSAPVDAGTCSVPVTMSAGVVAQPAAGGLQGAIDWQRAIRLADWALYHGKANGRNQAQIVTRLSAPIEEVLAALAASSHEQVPDELIGMTSVPGPAQQAA